MPWYLKATAQRENKLKIPNYNRYHIGKVRSTSVTRSNTEQEMDEAKTKSKETLPVRVPRNYEHAKLTSRCFLTP